MFLFVSFLQCGTTIITALTSLPMCIVGYSLEKVFSVVDESVCKVLKKSTT